MTIVPASTGHRGDSSATAGNSPSHRLGQDVFLLAVEGGGRILDFERGQFFGLDAVSTAMVTEVLRRGPDAAVSRIISEYSVAAEQVLSDLNQLLDKLERQRLLVPVANSTRPLRLSLTRWLGDGVWILDSTLFRPARNLWRSIAVRTGGPRREDEQTRDVPGTGMVGWLLTLSWISLRLFGWTDSIALWRRWHRQSEAATSPAGRKQIETVDRVIRKAAARKTLVPVACKERALVGHQILRGFLNLPSTIVVGVQRHPFIVHAWVECDGQYVTDDAARCEPFTPVTRYS